MKTIYSIILFVSISIISCTDNLPPDPPPAEGPFNEERLNIVAKSFYDSTDGILGTMHQIIQGDNNYLWVNANGYTDLNKNQEIIWNDKFSIGNISKTFTSAVVLLLLEEGLFKLDDKIIDYLPDNIVALIDTVPNIEDVTIYHTLSHKSGIYNYTRVWRFIEDIYEQPWVKMNTIDMLNYIIEDGQPYFKPGNGYKYSNTNYILLGELIKFVTHKTLSEVFTEKIFIPLSLQNTYLEEGILGSSAYDVVHGYDDEFDRKYDLHEFNFSGWGGAAGGIISTTEDMNKFFIALVNGRLFKSETTFSLMLDDIDNEMYGLGIFVDDHPIAGRYYGHGGGQLGMSCIAFYFVESDVMVSIAITYDGTIEYIKPENELDLFINEIPIMQSINSI